MAETLWIKCKQKIGISVVLQEKLWKGHYYSQQHTDKVIRILECSSGSLWLKAAVGTGH
jgi:hypothetical protein